MIQEKKNEILEKILFFYYLFTIVYKKAMSKNYPDGVWKHIRSDMIIKWFI